MARCPVSLPDLLGLNLHTLGLAGPLGSAPTIFYIFFSTLKRKKLTFNRLKTPSASAAFSALHVVLSLLPFFQTLSPPPLVRHFSSFLVLHPNRSFLAHLQPVYRCQCAYVDNQASVSHAPPLFLLPPSCPSSSSAASQTRSRAASTILGAPTSASVVVPLLGEHRHGQPWLPPPRAQSPPSVPPAANSPAR